MQNEKKGGKCKLIFQSIPYMPGSGLLCNFMIFWNFFQEQLLYTALLIFQKLGKLKESALHSIGESCGFLDQKSPEYEKTSHKNLHGK